MFSKVLWKVSLLQRTGNWSSLSLEGLLNVFSLQNTCERVSISKRSSFWRYLARLLRLCEDTFWSPSTSLLKRLPGLLPLVYWGNALASSSSPVKDTSRVFLYQLFWWKDSLVSTSSPTEGDCLVSTSSSTEGDCLVYTISSTGLHPLVCWRDSLTIPPALLLIRLPGLFFPLALLLRETSWSSPARLLEETPWSNPARLLKETIETLWLPPARLLTLDSTSSSIEGDYWDSLASISIFIETHWPPALLWRLLDRQLF